MDSVVLHSNACNAVEEACAAAQAGTNRKHSWCAGLQRLLNGSRCSSTGLVRLEAAADQGHS